MLDLDEVGPQIAMDCHDQEDLAPGIGLPALVLMGVFGLIALVAKLVKR